MAGGRVPELAIAVALCLAVVTFGFFIAFIHDIVNALQASDLIQRIAADAQGTIRRRYPDDLGGEPEDMAAAQAAVHATERASDPCELRSPRAGYLVAVHPDVIGELSSSDALLQQKVMIGDFVVTGQLLACLWCREDPDDLGERLTAAFELSYERTVVQDVAFPVRQLADVALKGLSPSLNDPTTAENAMNSVAETLVLFAERGAGMPIRVDAAGAPRFVACAPSLDDLTRLGFEQVRVKGASYPVFAARLVELLGHVRRAAHDAGTGTREVERQAELLAAGVADQVPIKADVERVRDAVQRLERGA